MLQDASHITIVAALIEPQGRLYRVKQLVDIDLGIPEAQIESGGIDSNASSNNRE